MKLCIIKEGVEDVTVYLRSNEVPKNPLREDGLFHFDPGNMTLSVDCEYGVSTYIMKLK